MVGTRAERKFAWWLGALVCWTQTLICLAADEVPAGVPHMLREHCLECHQGTNASAGLDLTQLKWQLDDDKTRAAWVTIHDRIDHGEMPPDSRLSMEQREAATSSLKQPLRDWILQQQRSQGRTAMRRLTRFEFEKTLHQLLGIDVPLKHLLPAEPRTLGFDKIAGSQHVSAIQIEKYLDAVDLALNATFRLTAQPERQTKRYWLKDEKEIRENLDKPENEVDPVSGNKHRQLFYQSGDAIVFISHGYSPDNIRQFSPAADGVYRVRIAAHAVHPGPDPVALRLSSSDWKNNRLLGYFEVLADKPRIIDVQVSLTTQEHLRINGYNIGVDAQGKTVWNVDSIRDWQVPGLAVEWIEVDGPLVEQWPPKVFQQIIGPHRIHKLSQPGRWTEQGPISFELTDQDSQAAIEDVVNRFASSAFRHPLNTGEAQAYINLAQAQLQAGADLQRALRVAMRAILVSPSFLYFTEHSGPLDDFALANRLSYFLTSAQPDQELISLAQSGELRDREILRQQASRLLASPQAQSLVENFTDQWLELDLIDATAPDMRLYPEYDELLRASMVREAREFFNELLAQDLPAINAIDSEFVVIDRRLSTHYGIEIEASGADRLWGEMFRKVKLPPAHVRGGFVTQAGVLKVTANGTVTSPVRRGAWILKQLLGTPPQPPPPVEAIEPDTRGSTTIRQQLEKHRTSATCNRCHSQIDPPGFALESFDVIGGYRERYRSLDKGDPITTKWQGRDIWEYRAGLPVDCAGTTADGQAFTDCRDFKQYVIRNPRLFLRNLVGLFVTYATGSTISFADRDAVEQIVDRSLAKGGGLRTIILEVVDSELFRSK